ncbi:hypothetical protein B7R54_14455 [Subtercola boreus]|uniref:HTH tetR-type domain-containing protein n=1 Tax=Subtercola boreus TaxID=120213 RepID=A0A3E0VKW4_9MICO|nr:TetR/AcrR family transcriptional regulator [Subtercola boreus]RFA10275.1 hypothetical protein B7R54_14455 [Subtercola boreus]TQL52543.1 TetR family transcriptional regulator [Subtercola boreus]
MSEEPQKRGRGRPRAASETAIAAVGLRLILENGFDETTMDDIAAAAGISRPTLFRWFPSKSSLVWHGSQRDASWLREKLSAAPPDRGTMDVLCDVLPELIHSDDSELTLLRSQVTVITSIPAVQGHTDEKMAEFTLIVAEFVAGRLGLQADDLLPQVASRTVWAASWTALALWAASDDDHPEPWLSRAFEGLRRGFRTEP